MNPITTCTFEQTSTIFGKCNGDSLLKGFLKEMVKCI